MGARRLTPDLPQTYPPPPLMSAVDVSGGGTFIGGTYFLVATYINPWGETLPTPEATVTIPSGDSMQITVTGPIPPGVTGTRIYMTAPNGGSGSEQYYVQLTGAFPQTIAAFPMNTAAPPVNNTAFNPDTDGTLMSAGQMFFWFNEGLTQFSRIIQGIRDYSGVPSQQGQPMYILPETWFKIDNIWYDGYIMKGGKKGDFFRRNAIVSGVLCAATISILDDRTIMEIYPQPARSGGATTTTNDMALTDTSVGITDSGAFLLPFGFAQIGTEIVQYSSTAGNTLTGLIRRLGGTAAAAWPNGTSVLELNLVVAGRRVVTTAYAPGSSLAPLPLPPGWNDILVDYLLAKAREAEQDDKNAKRLMDQFGAKAEKLAKQTNVMTGQAQIGPSPELQVYFPISNGGGGVIIP